jgi:DNA-binding beta-propeller fold protein YncE
MRRASLSPVVPLLEWGMRKPVWRAIGSLVALLSIAVPWGLPMTPARAEDPVAESGREIVASNLEGPRGMAFGPDGALYVVEAGRGGEECVEVPEPPAFGDPRLCFGRTGSITRVSDGGQERVATGLPSHVTGGQVTGVQDIVVAADGAIYLTLGYAQDPAYRGQLSKTAGLMGRLVSVGERGLLSPVADLAAHELARNPEQAGGDHSNPFGVAIHGGAFLVIDSAGNDLLRVEGDGAISTVAVFPPQLVEDPASPGTLIPMASVPTSVAVGPDGAYYVGEFTGSPFVVGAARIWRVVPGEEPAVYASGFTAVIDLAFAADGGLYVLEAVKGGLGAVNPRDPASLSGALWRLAPDGTRTVVADQGLIFPTSVLIGPEGAVYVTNNGIVPGRGQVLRLQP